MKSVVFWDSLQSWGPGVSRPMGGWEVMCRQLCEGLAGAGVEVHAYRAGGSTVEHNGVRYWDSRDEHALARCNALILGRNSRRPMGPRAEKIVVAAVDDPRYEKHEIVAPVVCLSEWQASMFRDMGHTAWVIPSMIDDWIYDLKPVKRANSYVCVNAWNKGTDATLRLWKELALPGELTVGSPYGAPEDAYQRCAAVGARWVGQLNARQVVAELASAEAVFRVCERPETFGVTDAIAEVVGTRVHCLCTNGVGATAESLSEGAVVVTDPGEFAQWVRWRPGPGGYIVAPRSDYRVSTIIPRWIKALRFE